MISGSGPSPQAPGLRLRLARGRATGAGPGPQAGLPVQWPSHGTGPHSMHGVMPASYPGGVCDTVDQPGTGSALFYINSWAMVFPSDHPAD